jgi:hypothetical protein
MHKLDDLWSKWEPAQPTGYKLHGAVSGTQKREASKVNAALKLTTDP